MPRIRSFKPEFFTSAQVVECSTNARLLFLGMWCWCDDKGVHPASVKQAKMEVFPGDEFAPEQIGGFIAELIENRLLIEYEGHDGQRYWSVTGWHHQRIDKPQPAKYPAPPNAKGGHEPDAFPDHSGNGAGIVQERSRLTERNGTERTDTKGTEGESERVRSLNSVPGKNRSGKVFSTVTVEMLQDTKALMFLQKLLVAAKADGINASESDLLRIVTAAECALESGDKPPALFTSILKKDSKIRPTNVHEDRAKLRIDKAKGFKS